MKECRRCNTLLPYSDYYTAKGNKDGFQTWCKKCQLKVNKIHVQQRKDFGPSIFRDSKTCCTCLTKKPISQFTKKTSAADGYQSYCRPCWTSYVKKAKRKNKI